MEKWAVPLALVGAAFAYFGCSDHDHHAGAGAHDSPYPTCKAIIDACHPYDVGEGPVHDCHDQAHEAAGEASCIPIKDNCIQLCEAAGRDAGADGGR